MTKPKTITTADILKGCYMTAEERAEQELKAPGSTKYVLPAENFSFRIEDQQTPPALDGLYEAFTKLALKDIAERSKGTK